MGNNMTEITNHSAVEINRKNGKTHIHYKTSQCYACELQPDTLRCKQTNLPKTRQRSFRFEWTLLQ